MKIQFLGTAAAEGIPAMFCKCPVCLNALAVRGKEVKTRSQAIVDDKILIDFPADTYMHMLQHNIDLAVIRTLIITHSHSDHFYERDFWCRLPGIANEIGEEPLHVYMTAAALRQAEEFANAHMKGNTRVVFHEIRPFEPFEAEGYRFIPLRANHDRDADPVFYIIEKDGKSALYANDTGIFPDETVEYLASYGRPFDFVSLDCTGMLLTGWRNGHMDLGTNAEMYAKLREMGLCTENTVAYVNHFSHNGKATHEELVSAASLFGFGVTYDGCTVEF